MYPPQRGVQGGEQFFPGASEAGGEALGHLAKLRGPWRPQFQGHREPWGPVGRSLALGACWGTPLWQACGGTGPDSRVPPGGPAPLRPSWGDTSEHRSIVNQGQTLQPPRPRPQHPPSTWCAPTLAPPAGSLRSGPVPGTSSYDPNVFLSCAWRTHPLPAGLSLAFQSGFICLLPLALSLLVPLSISALPLFCFPLPVSSRFSAASACFSLAACAPSGCVSSPPL